MKKLMFAILLSISILACKKETTQRPQISTLETDIIGTWQLSQSTCYPSYDFNDDGVLDSDRFSAMRICDRYFTLKFDKNGLGTLKQDCTPQEDLIEYKITDGNTTIRWNLQGARVIIDSVISVNSTTLIMETKNYFQNHTLTNTYTKQ